MIGTYSTMAAASKVIKVERGNFVDSDLCLSLLEACYDVKGLFQCKRVHAHIMKNTFRPNIFLQNALVRMHAQGNSLGDARWVFDDGVERNLTTWNIMFGVYIKHGLPEDALKLFGQMEQEGMQADGFIFVFILKACAIIRNLSEAKRIHTHIIKGELKLSIFMCNSLLDMYAKCGSIKDARQVFNKMCERDLITWTAMIAGYAKHGQGEEALRLFWEMGSDGIKPDGVVFLSILKACASVGKLQEGKRIHTYLLRTGINTDLSMSNTLADMYFKCGSLKDACQLFYGMPKRDVVSWNIMILGYAKHGSAQKVFQLHQEMAMEGTTPDKFTIVSILNACASLGRLEEGRWVHCEFIKTGFVLDVFTANALIDMYSKCGCIPDARCVFDQMPEQDIVSWTSMIAGYAKSGPYKEACVLFRQMKNLGMEPNKVTFLGILNACASQRDFEQGRLIHADIIKSGLDSDSVVLTSLVDTYAKCGDIERQLLFMLQGADQMFNHGAEYTHFQSLAGLRQTTRCKYSLVGSRAGLLDVDARNETNCNCHGRQMFLAGWVLPPRFEMSVIGNRQCFTCPYATKDQFVSC